MRDDGLKKYFEEQNLVNYPHAAKSLKMSLLLSFERIEFSHEGVDASVLFARRDSVRSEGLSCLQSDPQLRLTGEVQSQTPLRAVTIGQLQNNSCRYRLPGSPVNHAARNACAFDDVRSFHKTMPEDETTDRFDSQKQISLQGENPSSGADIR